MEIELTSLEIEDITGLSSCVIRELDLRTVSDVERYLERCRRFLAEKAGEEISS